MKENSPKSGKNTESVWDYPRPPAIEQVSDRIRVVFNGETIADSHNTIRVLETSHPPVYYIPLADIQPAVLIPVAGQSWCEWKGSASYYDLKVGDRMISRAAWYYPSPTGKFQSIMDHVAFYPGKVDACFVGDEQVRPQEGDFYGGWITSNIVGPFKGGPGTAGW